jgi:hypothetical protein
MGVAVQQISVLMRHNIWMTPMGKIRAICFHVQDAVRTSYHLILLHLVMKKFFHIKTQHI